MIRSVLFRSRAVTNRKISEKTYFFHTCATCPELPSNISTTLAINSCGENMHIAYTEQYDHHTSNCYRRKIINYSPLGISRLLMDIAGGACKRFSAKQGRYKARGGG